MICFPVSLESSRTTLYLQPGDKKVQTENSHHSVNTWTLQVIKAAGEDNSAFVSCRGEAGERLTWSHLTPGPLEAGLAQLVSISTAPGDRVHTETRPGALDLVFRSVLSRIVKCERIQNIFSFGKCVEY